MIAGRSSEASEACAAVREEEGVSSKCWVGEGGKFGFGGRGGGSRGRKWDLRVWLLGRLIGGGNR